MKLHDIVSPVKRKMARRVGRGMAAGQGKTAGRGTKGQKSRAGYIIPRRFEGGQTPLIQRLPKTGGFTSMSAQYPTVQVGRINTLFKSGERVSPKTLFEKGLINAPSARVKLIGPGKLKQFVRLENILLTKRLVNELPQPPKSPPATKLAVAKSKPSKKSSPRKKGK